MSNLLKSLSGMNRASAAVAKIQMSPKQVENLSAKLKTDNRMNVYPNKFDVAKPFRVVTNVSGEFTTHGYFTSVDVASAVGTICSKANFGDKALAGEFDETVVAEHPEFLAWMEDTRNQATIAKASGIEGTDDGNISEF